MNEHHFEDQKVILPSSQGLEEMERVDKTKVFWTVILALFIVSFVFILGYWIGQQRATADYFKIMPNNSVDVSPLMGAPEEPMDGKNAYTGDGLEALDSATTNTTPNNIPNNNQVPINNTLDMDPSDTVESVNNPITIKERNNNTNPEILEPSNSINNPAFKKPVIKAKKNIKAPVVKKMDGKWAVRLATVKSEKNALALKANLIKMGYTNVNMAKIGVLYRISVLGFETQTKAQEFKDLAKQKLNLADTLIIKLK